MLIIKMMNTIVQQVAIGSLICGDAGGAPVFCDFDKFSAFFAFEKP